MSFVLGFVIGALGGLSFATTSCPDCNGVDGAPSGCQVSAQCNYIADCMADKNCNYTPGWCGHDTCTQCQTQSIIYAHAWRCTSEQACRATYTSLCMALR